MTRISRPDTLHTELREVQRRLRLLEATGVPPVTPTPAAHRGDPPPDAPPPDAALPAASPPGEGLVPLMPARRSDWPATGSADWERLSVTWAGPEEGVRLLLRCAADAGTTGEVRVVVDGSPAWGPRPVTPALVQLAVPVRPQGRPERRPQADPEGWPELGSEIAVEARRTAGDGLVRVAALSHRR